MTKQEQIEKMAVIGCVRNPQAHTAEECSKCDFKQGMCNAYRHAEALYNAGYSDVTGCKAEIERLKANGCRSIMDTFENNRDKIVENIQTEIDDYKQSIKQVKIDMLNEVKKCSRCDNFFPDGNWHRYVLISDIDILIEEVENDK